MADLSDCHSVAPGRLAYFTVHTVFKVYPAVADGRVSLLLRLANRALCAFLSLLFFSANGPWDLGLLLFWTLVDGAVIDCSYTCPNLRFQCFQTPSPNWY